MRALLVLLLAGLTLAGCADDEPEETDDPPVVDVEGFQFKPPTLTVKAGTAVTFHNLDSADHTATADDGSFDTGTLEQHAPKVQTFATVGTYPYHCDLHPSMKGVIRVTA